MPSLLAITASPRGDYSLSTQLTHTFVDTWKKAHGGGNVVMRDLYKTELPFIDVPWMMGAYSSPADHTPEVKKALAIGNELIAELMAADHIVMGAPMYNFTVPAIIKAWIDHIARVNVTFSPSYEGLIKGKKMTIIIASGGIYTEGTHMAGMNFETSYLKGVLGFLGITDLSFVMAGGSSDINTGKTTLEALTAKYAPEVEAAAK